LRLHPECARVSLDRLESLCGTAERAPCLAELVRRVNASDAALWGFDCPFGLPLELFPTEGTWAEQFAFIEEYGEEAYACGMECIARTKRMGAGPLRSALHCRRQTDLESKAPFDAFHYRMIYQTFHGMRDVVAKLARRRGTMVAPLQPRRARTARRVLVEACPSSTLKRLGLPHQNYKQPTGGPLTSKRRRTRAFILSALARHIDLSDRHRRLIMRNPGGDALDAVIAAVGGYHAWLGADHRAIGRHARYPLEGRIYA
jgi:hypothetical protein